MAVLNHLQTLAPCHYRLQACVELLLRVPPGSGLLGDGASQLLPLRLGLSLGAAGAPQLALAAADALERWEAERPEELRRMLPFVVPLLEPFLQDLSRLTVPQGQLDIDREVRNLQDQQPVKAERKPAVALFDDMDDVEGFACIGGGEDKAEGGGGDQGRPEGPAGGDGVTEARSTLAKEERESREAATRLNSARRKGLASLQPRLQLWLGRMGCASGLLAAPANDEDDFRLLTADRCVCLSSPFQGFESLASKPQVCGGKERGGEDNVGGVGIGL